MPNTRLRHRNAPALPNYRDRHPAVHLHLRRAVVHLRGAFASGAPAVAPVFERSSRRTHAHASAGAEILTRDARLSRAIWRMELDDAVRAYCLQDMGRCAEGGGRGGRAVR
jgi:hypothetical protein